MKMKHRKERLLARQKFYDNLSKADQAAYTKPGSLNK